MRRANCPGERGAVTRGTKVLTALRADRQGNGEDGRQKGKNKGSRDEKEEVGDGRIRWSPQQKFHDYSRGEKGVLKGLRKKRDREEKKRRRDEDVI